MAEAPAPRDETPAAAAAKPVTALPLPEAAPVASSSCCHGAH
jgi:hypothetical protein